MRRNLILRRNSKDLDKLAELAGINHFAVKFDPVDNRALALCRRQFAYQVIGAVRAAQYVSAVQNAARLKEVCKPIGMHAGKLADVLRNMTEIEARQFAELSQSSCKWTPEDILHMTKELAQTANRIYRLGTAQRISRLAMISRRVFVQGILDAASDAGGEFKLDRRTEHGSLMEALKILRPYVPAEFSARLSFVTVRRIREEWIKKRKNRT